MVEVVESEETDPPLAIRYRKVIEAHKRAFDKYDEVHLLKIGIRPAKDRDSRGRIFIEVSYPKEPFTGVFSVKVVYWKDMESPVAEMVTGVENAIEQVILNPDFKSEKELRNLPEIESPPW